VENAATMDESIWSWHCTEKIKSLDVILPTREKKIRLRVLATAPKELKILLQRMKVLLSSRPKIIENVVQKKALFKA
jgi:hypothetical protein